MKHLIKIILFLSISISSCKQEGPKVEFSAKIAYQSYKSSIEKQINFNYSDTLQKQWGRLNLWDTKESLYSCLSFFINNDSVAGVDCLKNLITAANLKQKSIDGVHGLHIGNLYIQPVRFNFRRQAYYAYNNKYNTYYTWYPPEFATYVLQQDSTSIHNFVIKTTFASLVQKKEMLYKNEMYKDVFFFFGQKEAKTYSIIEHKNTNSHLSYSLKDSYFFSVFKNIIGEMKTLQQIDSLLPLFQNQCNYSGYSPIEMHCIYFSDSTFSTKTTQKILIEIVDTCKIKSQPYSFLDIYEKQSIADLAKLELIYPDLTKEKIPEIAAYAAQTKPTFIYFKRAYRSSYRHEPYYYFIFYYVDFSPFLPPRLRDMQVVFPRRFGLS